MKKFETDVKHWVDYDFVVINDDLNTCYNKIMNKIKNKRKTLLDREFIKKHVKSLMT